MGFLGSIRSAFQYVEKAVETAISSVQSFAQFVAGGGELEEKEFIGAYDKFAEYKQGWGKIPQMSGFETISKEFSMPVPFDFENSHIMKMKVFATNLATGKREERWVTVETDKPLSRREWTQEAKNASVSGRWLYDLTINYIAEYQYYTREETYEI